MSGFTVVNNTDTRFQTLQKGFNLRWPDDEGADYIYLCDSAQAVIDAGNDALAKGRRITVRSGGSCYEGLVANKLKEDGSQPLAIIDLSEMKGMRYDETGNVTSPWDASAHYKFSLSSGNQNWDGYNSLYKSANRTIPGGSCYAVGAGGHIAGGGFGLLSRMHGTTVDWLSGVDILVSDGSATGLVVKHVSLNSTGSERDLFIACRGAGGGNFGIILNYYFSELPVAPQTVYLLTLAYPWSNFTTQAQFDNFMRTYWQWFADHDADWSNSDPALANGGLFTLLKVQHRTAGDIKLVIQYTGMSGTVGGVQDQPFIDFVNAMNSAAGFTPQVNEEVKTHGPMLATSQPGRMLQDPVGDARLMDWLYATQTMNTSGDNRRGKYKSSYQKGQFGQQELNTLWAWLNNPAETRINQMLVQYDSYGGCINTHNETTDPTSIHQRHSILKSQFQVYWLDAADDEFYLDWMWRFYTEYFADYGGKPYDSDNYEGCYINYPDVDMKYTDEAKTMVDPQWLSLYYGDKAAMLQATKASIDPNNIFHSELSIPAV
ncbi:FAD-binding oxidoreductase [Enterobacter sp. A11]|uniref:BBE domain-containing protein n=1 Tax=unclassified Enterobacter TaxID=2608935 RepID=UPI00106F80DE|nr:MULTISPECIES: BBE domain-containing protein [unclassified Enterobacter]MBM1020198.1 FAD-binding oxidoreductase [Enterobacter sp. E1]MEA3561498.1 BBE domain-containing protein [Enterobacter sp. GM-22]MEA3595205.1 BBE domain-containing protein [Enterobacter sp. GM-31]TFF60342.1 FAD-binding oxidoreductase [Enterobacter sp. A11]